MTQPTPPKSPTALPQTWDVIASAYALESWRMPTYAAEALDLAAPAPEARVLDVAAGSGTVSLVAAARVAQVVAVDFSSGMLEQLRQRAEREGVRNIDARVMDAQALDFPDASFDAALCMFAFMFFPDRGRAFAELRRVLRPGARAVVGTWGPIAQRPLMKVGFDALAEAMPDVPSPQKGDLQDPEENVVEMSAAGFHDVRCHRVVLDTHFASAEAYLELMLRTSAPVAMARKRAGEEGWPEVRARLLAVLERSIPATGASLAAEALLTVGAA